MTFLVKAFALGALLANGIPVAPANKAEPSTDPAGTDVADIRGALGINAPLIIQGPTNSSGTAEPWPLTAATPEAEQLSVSMRSMIGGDASQLKATQELLASMLNSSDLSVNESEYRDEMRRILDIYGGIFGSGNYGDHVGPDGHEDQTIESDKGSKKSEGNSPAWHTIGYSVAFSAAALALCCGLNHARGTIEQRVREAMQRGAGPGELSGIAAQLML